MLDTLTLANYEYYSATVRKFQVLGSLDYPCQKWVLLGEFEANDTRSEQIFEIPQPMCAPPPLCDPAPILGSSI